MKKQPFRSYCAAGCGEPVFSKKETAKYCSPQCARHRFDVPRGNCLRCETKLKRHQAKYCSLRCANSRSDANRSPGPCRICGKTVALAKQVFCSQACHRKNEFLRRCELLERGGYCGVYNCNGFVRKYLVFHHGERCSRCGWDKRHPKTGRVPVEVEHIDGDWRNNRVDNITLLCPNCHSLTDTYRGLNRGRGRAKRLGGREHPLSRYSPRAAATPSRGKGREAHGGQLALLPPT